jgi:hypothetical protein
MKFLKLSTTPNQILNQIKEAMAIVAVVALASCSNVMADQRASAIDHPPSRARYVNRDDDSSLRFTPVMLSDGSRLTLISPRYWSDISEEISLEVVRTHQHLTKLLGNVPPFRSSVRLLDERSFYELTGAPGWTNAMFFRGEIIIPISLSQPIDIENIRRSVKHEYSHAVLSALSGGQIPGWLDEGLAQWIEGDENPALRATLKSYLKRAQPVPLALLQGGFTKLSPQMVPAAYAQSLLAVQALIKAYGISKFSEYLSALRDEEDRDLAFEKTFGINLAEFEQRLSNTLIRWARPSGNVAPELRAPELRAAAHSHR